jgi:hypothetical protein
MRTGRDIEEVRRRLADAKVERDQQRASGLDEVFGQAYVAVKTLELRLDEMLRETTRGDR